MYEAAGRQFRTEADYKLALHDKAEIEKIKVPFVTNCD